MPPASPQFDIRLATTAADLRAAGRLRYRVFVLECGGDGPLVDHDSAVEQDHFDEHCQHLVLVDSSLPPGDHVVGLYRLMTADGVQAAGQYYTETEYDLAPLLSSGRQLLELGRSCLHPAYRGGAAMFHLWQGLASLINETGAEVLFGTASLAGTDPVALAQPLSYLHHAHLAPPDLRVRSRVHQPMDLLAPEQIDRPRALLHTPALIKAYLRLGGVVGEGAFVDQAFNTTDVCLILDTAQMNARQRAIYAKGISG
jgi:L-ornithine Nalpha-acyltransferase